MLYGNGDHVVHAELSWPLGGGIMIGSVRDNPEDPWPIQPGTTGCYVVTDDPDQLHARAVGAGALFVISMGLSRVYLGHHWLTDVIAGWLLGLAWLTVVVTAHRLHLTIRRRRERA